MRPGLGGAAALLVAAGILTGCGTGSADQPLVVVTTDVLGDVVGELVGAQAEVMTLMPRGSDPHSFEVSAQDAARLRSADLVVSNGLGLEEGLAAQVEAARADGVPVLEAGTAIEPLQWVSEDASGLDPHFWTDPARMTTVTEVLADALTEHVEGIDVDVLAADVADYQGRLAELDAWMGEQLAQVPADRRNLVTNHHVFGYLADRFDLTVIGAVIPSGTTLAAPSASDLDELAASIREARVRTIFVDSAQPDRLAQVLAEQAGVDVTVTPLFTESLSGPGEGAETYLAMMRANTEDIVSGLR